MIDLGEIAHDEPPAPRPPVVRAWLARRKRWIAAGSVLVLLGIGWYAVLGGPVRKEPTPQPSPAPMKRIEGFPEYAQGAHVVAAASAPVTAGEVTLSWTVTDFGVTVFDRCEFLAADGTLLKTDFLVDGVLWSGSGCGPDDQPSGSRLGAEAWTAHGISLGDTVRLTMRLGKATVFDAAKQINVDAEQPRIGTIGLAVGVPVPFEQYPLPPRPTALPSLNVPSNGEAGSEVMSSDSADPLRPISLDLTWRGSYDLSLSSTTPGVLSITVDGIPVYDCEIWTYEGDSCGLGWTVGTPDGFAWQSRMTARPGETVHMTITPTHVTGPWGVRITSS
ncbi:MAG: hypothetical protein HOU81_20425 [Hamadaea sp.]|uniref:hypothetical protein n=1 Tax=Hamadaea sp. TaxID=2024425 RepID=UPI0017C5D36F|nr:hypothetical protein [Hamadaea sp.]NUR73191.1 hypothetical protein [Hamadaea sp.]NUT21055.1 hypothetical protein [Hamadaea sp.]